MPQSPRLASLRCPAAKENAMIERDVIDEASLWSQSLLFMANRLIFIVSRTLVP